MVPTTIWPKYVIYKMLLEKSKEFITQMVWFLKGLKYAIYAYQSFTLKGINYADKIVATPKIQK